MQEELIRAAFERCPSGLLIVDESGRITMLNEQMERLLGYQRAELLGQPVEVLLPFRFVETHAEHRAQYLAHPSSRPMGAGRDLYARHKDGRDIPVEIGLSTVQTASGRFVLSTIIDIRERLRLEERLRQTHKLEALGNLASGIAHDFNNILLGITGYAELAQEAAVGRVELTQDLDVVLDSARRGRDLVSRILSFTRQSEPQRVTTPISSTLSEAMHLLSATLPSGIEIRQYYDPATPPILADSIELHQIIMNLANNAAHAMRARGGVIEVRVAPQHVEADTVQFNQELNDGLYAVLTVKDTGVGIAPENLQRVFEPFFTTKPLGEGTGLGLAVIVRIVRSMGGAVRVQSAEGVGTQFDVYFPSSVIALKPRDSDDISEPKHHCVLFVEDEAQLARLGQRILEAAGLKVIACTSSLVALETFKRDPRRFDLIVTDNTMPHMTGLELVARVRGIDRDIPILMASGVGDIMSFESLHERGVTRLLSKPYSAADLRTVVFELMSQRAEVIDSESSRRVR